MISEFELNLFQLNENEVTENQIFSATVPTYEVSCNILLGFKMPVQGEIEILFENGSMERIPISNTLHGLDSFKEWRSDFLSSISA